MFYKKLLLAVCCLCVVSGAWGSETQGKKEAPKFLIVFNKKVFPVKFEAVQLCRVLKEMFEEKKTETDEHGNIMFHLDDALSGILQFMETPLAFMSMLNAFIAVAGGDFDVKKVHFPYFKGLIAIANKLGASRTQKYQPQRNVLDELSNEVARRERMKIKLTPEEIELQEAIEKEKTDEFEKRWAVAEQKLALKPEEQKEEVVQPVVEQKFKGFKKFNLKIGKQGEPVAISPAGLQLSGMLVDIVDAYGDEKELIVEKDGHKSFNVILDENAFREHKINKSHLEKFVALADNPESKLNELSLEDLFSLLFLTNFLGSTVASHFHPERDLDHELLKELARRIEQKGLLEIVKTGGLLWDIVDRLAGDQREALKRMMFWITDLQVLRKFEAWPEGWLNALAVSPEGMLIAEYERRDWRDAFTAGRIVVRNPKNGAIVSTVEHSHALTWYPYFIILPDGTFAARLAFEDFSTIRIGIVNPTTGQKMSEIRRRLETVDNARVLVLDVFASGILVLMDFGGGITFWDPKTGGQIYTEIRPGGFSRGLVAVSEEKLAVEDSIGGGIVFYNPKTGKKLHKIGSEWDFHLLKVLSDGNLFAFGRHKKTNVTKATIWDPRTGVLRKTLPVSISPYRLVSLPKMFIVNVGDTIQIVDIEQERSSILDLDKPVRFIVGLPGGTLAIGCDDGEIQIVELLFSPLSFEKIVMVKAFEIFGQKEKLELPGGFDTFEFFSEFFSEVVFQSDRLAALFASFTQDELKKMKMPKDPEILQENIMKMLDKLESDLNKVQWIATKNMNQRLKIIGNLLIFLEPGKQNPALKKYENISAQLQLALTKSALERQKKQSGRGPKEEEEGESDTD